MKKMLFFTFFLVFVFSLFTDAQVKRVLLEQYTGAWCGWCVDGSYIMDQIIEEHPDQVIGVKLHYGDSMQIETYSEIAAAFGISSFPSGSIDRKKFSGKVPQSRSVWKSYCESQMAESPKVEVNVAYNIDETTRQLQVKVYANMLTTVWDPLRFNVIITEDSVSGKGTGWDQHNYLYHRAGYENNPYYNLPSTIVGYQHVKVVRAYLGGAFGVQGSLETPAKQGNVYTYDFSYTLPKNWKIEHLHIIGLVSVDAPANKEVLNCAYGVESSASLLLTSSGERIGVADKGLPFTRKYTLKNISTSDKTFKFTTSVSERTPEDWTVTIPELSKDEVTLAAGKTFDFTLIIEPGATIGAGDAYITVEDMDDSNAFKGKGSVSVYSAKISDVEVVSAGENMYSLTPILQQLGYKDFFKLMPTEYDKIGDKLPAKKHIVWNTGSQTGMTTDDINNIKTALDEKIPIFACGNHIVSDLLTDDILLNYFGANYYGYSLQGFGQAPWQVWLSGVENDPISGPLGNSIEGNLIKYLITLVNPIGNNTYPFMHFKNEGLRVVYNNGKIDTLNVKGEDAVFGIRVDNNGYRTVLLSTTPYILINKNQRNTLIERIMRWLDKEPMSVDDFVAGSDEFTVSPIPASDNITFHYGVEIPKSIRIYNSLGMLVDEIYDLQSGAEYSYNSSTLPTGVYTAVLNGASKKFTTKFTIVR